MVAPTGKMVLVTTWKNPLLAPPGKNFPTPVITSMKKKAVIADDD